MNYFEQVLLIHEWVSHISNDDIFFSQDDFKVDNLNESVKQLKTPEEIAELQVNNPLLFFYSSIFLIFLKILY